MTSSHCLTRTASTRTDVHPSKLRTHRQAAASFGSHLGWAAYSKRARTVLPRRHDRSLGVGTGQRTNTNGSVSRVIAVAQLVLLPPRRHRRQRVYDTRLNIKAVLRIEHDEAGVIEANRLKSRNSPTLSLSYNKPFYGQNLYAACGSLV